VRSRARFAIAILLAAGLGSWLAWTSLGGSLETYASPAGLRAGDGGTYRLNGLVAPPAPADAAARAQSAEGLRFTLRDKKLPARTVAVLYRGTVPDTFRAGREVVVTGHYQDGVFVAKRNALTTLCPSKFKAKTTPKQAPPTGNGAGRDMSLWLL
jgi:cytochrome c-type biogenesis protein CcmE